MMKLIPGTSLLILVASVTIVPASEPAGEQDLSYDTFVEPLARPPWLRCSTVVMEMTP